jgi:murein DD-endopeptidase MepM/ murein hydrolase activator NlpD
VTAAKLAEEALQKAVAAKVAAEQARRAAEQAATTDPTTTDPTSTDPTSIPSGGGAVSPVPGAVIGAHFGDVGLWARYHTGLDFRAASGTPIRAVKAGVVLYAGNSGDWAGNHVAVKHADGMTTMYCHMSSIAAHVGQTVQAGQIIGYVGQTGRAFGPHLHFELYPPGVKYGDLYHAINPQPYLNANGVQTH